MLQKLNERIQGTIAWVIILLVAITFTLFGVDYYLQSRQASPSALVEVNDQPITKQSFELTYQRLRQAHDPAGLTAAVESQLKQQLLDDLILNQISLDSARQYGFSISAAQVNRAILQIPQFQENGHFSTNRYQHVLTNAWFTHESFLQEVRQGMLMNQQRFAFMGTAFALPNEVQHYIELYDQTRDYRYMTISPKLFLGNIAVSSDEIKDYYAKHLKEFLTPEQISLDYVRLSVADVKAQIHPSDEELLQYYDDNKSNYLDAQSTPKPFVDVQDAVREQFLAERVQSLYAQALDELSDLSYQTPDSLEPVAKKLKLPIEHTTLFSREGGHDAVTKHHQILQTAFSQDVLVLGNNSAPIQLDNENVVVVRVHERVPEKEKALADVSESIVSLVAQEKAQVKANALGEAIVHAKNDEERTQLMQAHHVSWHVVNGASRETKKRAQMLANELAYALPSQKVNALSGQASTDGQGYVVVELLHVQDGHMNTLDKEQLTTISKELAANDGLVDYDFYVNQLLSNAHIVKNPQS